MHVLIPSSCVSWQCDLVSSLFCLVAAQDGCREHQTLYHRNVAAKFFHIFHTGSEVLLHPIFLPSAVSVVLAISENLLYCLCLWVKVRYFT